MKLGVQVIHQSTSSLPALGKAADASSFDGVWLAGGGDNYLKSAVLLMNTTRVTVGTAIVPCLVASPALHSSSARFLQTMSGGRFILGMGSQTKGQIRSALGVDPAKPAKMGRETMELTRLLLRPDAFDYAGEFQRFRRGPAPRSEFPPPPVYYSGVNKLSLRIAGRYSDGFLAHPIFTRRYYEEIVWPEMEAGLAKAKRPRDSFTMVAMPMSMLVDTEKERDEALRRAKSNIAFYFTTRAYGTFMDFHGWADERIAIQNVLAASSGRIDHARLRDTISNEIVDEICLIGSAQEIRQKANERYRGIADVLDFYSVHDGADASDERQRLESENISRLFAAFDGRQFDG